MNTQSNQLKMDWRFPLPHTHDGLLMGNGIFGVCVWGDGKLCLTTNRADYWDLRNHRPVTTKMRYEEMRAVCETQDLERMGRMVDPREPPPDSRMIPNPSGLPMGRIELDVNVQSASLAMADGVLSLDDADGQTHRLAVDPLEPLYVLETQRTQIDIVRRPAWEFLGEYLDSIGHEPPQMFEQGAISGWTNQLPDGLCLCVACARIDGGLAVMAVYGEDADQARADAQIRLAAVNISDVMQSTRDWWQSYWQQIPQVDLPSHDDEEVYYYGLFKLAGLTKEHPSLLQGPWVEEYQMPDAANDYHFNINVQMCYWPTYAANCPQLLSPLFDRLKRWQPHLQRYAKDLYGVDDGIFLPMSCSTTGRWLGNFWPSFTDHANAGWAAHLMWLHYQYSMDADFLRDTAYPFMKGAMRVYESILEEEEDGSVCLPMSTSPEFLWAGFRAVGKNTSFQLACIHFLLEALIESTQVLDIDHEQAAAWRELKEKVPLYTTYTQEDTSHSPWSPWGDIEGRPRLALYEGQDLECSHRHHSYLAALHPFDTVDFDEPQHAAVMHPTLYRFIEAGPGNWIAFTFVWTSVIYSRLRDGDAAYLHYQLWHQLFTTKYRSAVELSRIPGFTTWTDTGASNPMQMDAAMGAVYAIQEMLLQTVRGVMRVFPAVPRDWQNDVAFEKMRAPGAFLVSARMQDGRITRVEIFSEKGATLKMVNNIADEIAIIRGGEQQSTGAKVLTLQTNPDETIMIQSAAEAKA